MSPITEKYRQAAIIAQSTLRAVILQLHRNLGEQTIGEVCRFGDELIKFQIDRCYKNVEEKGVARPVEICKNEFSNGVAPEEFDTFQSSIVNDGDVLKVTLGVHIDGYTVMAGHTIVIRDPSEQQIDAPLTGNVADSVIGSFLATEAVVSVLASTLSPNHPLHEIGSGSSELGSAGQAIRKIVNDIAENFNLAIVPGSKVRRIKRFVAGQITVQDSLPSVEWGYAPERDAKLEEELDAQFVAKPGHTYVVDIRMAPKLEPEGYIKVVQVPHVGRALDGPSIYTRDHTMKYQLRTKGARSLLAAIDQKLSVFPFKLSYLASELPLNQLKLGLNECVQRHLLVGEHCEKTQFIPEYRPKEHHDANSTREVCTVSLVQGKDSGSGYPELLRLSGGKQFPPSWVQSVYSVAPGVAADALNARMQQHAGVKYVEIKANNIQAPINAPGEATMETTVDADVDVEM